MSGEVLIDERMARLLDAGMVGKWLVNTDTVNLEDLMNTKPYGVVRCVGPLNDAVRFVPVETMGLEGCVAGWISEEDQ